MFLLALAAVAFLPMLIYTVQVGPQNAAIAAGNQLVSDGLTRAEASGLVSCAQVRNLVESFPALAAGTEPAMDHGISLTFVASSCSSGPLDYPRVLDVYVQAVQHEGTPNAAVLADAHQLIYVALP